MEEVFPAGPVPPGTSREKGVDGMKKILLSGCLLLAGCISAPQETVEVSEIVQQQISEMQRSHEAFVASYFDSLRERVERFMVERWTPSFLAKAVRNEEFRKQHAKYYEISRLDTSAVTFDVSGASSDPEVQAMLKEAIQAAIKDQQARFGQVLIAFGKEATKQIAIQRRKLLAPIDHQEEMVLAEIRSGYQGLHQASAALKAYLESVAEVTASRDVVLEKLGLLKTQRKVVNAAVTANEETLAAIEGVKDADAGLQSILKGFKEARDRIAGIIEKKGAE